MLKRIYKFLGWFISVFIIFIFVALAYFYYKFNYYQPLDTATLNEDNLIYYSSDYNESKAKFRFAANNLQEKYNQAQVGIINVPSKLDSNLYIDYLYIPSSQPSTKLIIISSGVHGIESYTGCAIQQLFMEEFIHDDLLSNAGILLIHTINPYGFKYGRRVSENNVDLNRNSSLDPKLYQTVNQGYPKVNDLINPTAVLNLSSFFHRFFFITAVNEIRKSSMPVLRQAILQGQYQYSKGLYFGGFNPEPQIDSLVHHIENLSKTYQEIMAIDLHTGYGERGFMHLFPNPVNSPLKEEMENLFHGYKIDWGDSDDFYVVTGDFVNLIHQLNPDKKFIPMTLEFGTMDSQTTLGSIKSLQLNVAENQGFQFGYKTEHDQQEIRKQYKEMYFPSSPIWQSHVIDQSRNFFTEILPRYTKTN